jgi:hypothetical protein
VNPQTLLLQVAVPFAGTVQSVAVQQPAVGMQALPQRL